MSAVITALIEVSRYNESIQGGNERVIPSPLREITVMSLGCEDPWTLETVSALTDLLCCIIHNSPTSSIVELRENAALGTRLSRKLRDSILSSAPASDKVRDIFQSSLEELKSLAMTESHDQIGRSRKLAGVQMIGAFVADGIFDITESRTEIILNSTAIGSHKNWKSSVDLTRGVVNFCILSANPQISGKQCHEAACSLVGIALSGRAAVAKEGENKDQNKPPKWVGELEKRFMSLCESRLDVFLNGLDRISKHHPTYPYETEFARLIQNSLENLVGKPRYVAFSALSYDITGNKSNIECTKRLLPRVRKLMANRDPLSRALLFDILSKGILFAKEVNENELLNGESKRLRLDVIRKIE